MEENIVEAIYWYVDENAAPLYRVVRFAGKKFKQERWEKGKWIAGLEETRRVIYNLPGVIYSDQAKPIWIVEGEKDANSLIELDLVATTAPMGAGKWNKEYNQLFKDRKVIILPDNDEVGRKSALEVAYELYSVTKQIKVVYLPGLPDHGDVTDWLASGKSKSDLINWVAKANKYIPRHKPEVKTSGSYDFKYVVDKIKKNVTLDNLISATIGHPAREDRNGKWALCPFHKEKTPSFKWGQDFFICFGCGEKGDLIDFYALSNRISQANAIKQLADLYCPESKRKLSKAKDDIIWQRRVVCDLAVLWRAFMNAVQILQPCIAELNSNPWKHPRESGLRKRIDQYIQVRDKVVPDIRLALDELEDMRYTGRILLGELTSSYSKDKFFTDYASKSVIYQRSTLESYIRATTPTDIFSEPKSEPSGQSSGVAGGDTGGAPPVPSVAS